MIIRKDFIHICKELLHEEVHCSRYIQEKKEREMFPKQTKIKYIKQNTEALRGNPLVTVALPG